jgi:exodeoxyribonuclease V alpha subunit
MRSLPAKVFQWSLPNGDQPAVFTSAETAAVEMMARRTKVTDENLLFVLAMAVWAHRNGHVCVHLDRIGEVTDRSDAPPVDALIASLAAHPAIVHQFQVGAHVELADACAIREQLVCVGNHVYTQRQFIDEISVAEQLRTRAAWVEDVSTPAALALIESQIAPRTLADGSTYTVQGDAARALLVKPFAVLTGGPGTGKTHTLTRSLFALTEALHSRVGDELTIAVCAPTGKAADRVTELLNQAIEQAAGALPEHVLRAVRNIKPSTIHSLLGHAKGQRTRFKYNSDLRLPHDLVIVDETSMVSLQMMARLLEAVRDDARVLLVGDDAQLQSVESGSILGDVVKAWSGSTDSPVFTLWHDFRTEQGGSEANGIAVVARAIRAGDADATKELLASKLNGVTLHDASALGDSAQVPVVLAGVVDALREARALAHSTDQKSHDAALIAVGSAKLLCGPRHGDLGVSAWNRYLAELLGAPSETALVPGTPVLITRNTPRVGLVNGDLGVVVNSDEGLRVYFARPEGSAFPSYLSIAELPEHEISYAMTIHKSQGSEYRDVVIILPREGSPLLTRELLYTGFTRAKRTVTVVASDSALTQAINTPAVRLSGLANLLT